MIATRFLTVKEYELYRTWLKNQDSDTLDCYFGVATSRSYIDHHIDNIIKNAGTHKFLVAYKGREWLGVLHLAIISEKKIEFGIMVSRDARNQGVGSELMSEAIIWAQNRGYETLYLHCLARNHQVQKLARKHRLSLHNDHGDVEVVTELAPPSLLTFAKEASITNKNIFMLFLNQSMIPLK